MPERQNFSIHSADGVTGSLRLIVPDEEIRAAVFWLPALGVGIRPNEQFAMALAGQGIAVAIHEWRGLGDSSVRASRKHDWSYCELLTLDIPASLEVARAALPKVPWMIGGHSLGAQLALLYASRHSEEFDCVWVVASGHPWWRTFSDLWAMSVWGLSRAIGPITSLFGFFPGHQLGFAGREARSLMRDWASTARTGRYHPPSMKDDLTYSLGLYRGAITAVRMRNDPYVPTESLGHLQKLAPRANWQVHVLDKHDFSIQKADHFSWLKDPGPVAHRLNAWARKHLPKP
jgi:predicted alpha/beta hydrolase